MPPNRIADLQLRGNTSPLPVRVYWPGQPTAQPAPLLVFCTVGDGAEASCRSLSDDLGLLVLAVSCPTGAQNGMTTLEWAAEHAAELGGDPGRLLIAGQDRGRAIAAAVASRARAAGWPAVTLAAGRDDAELPAAVRRSLKITQDLRPPMYIGARRRPTSSSEQARRGERQCARQPNCPGWPRMRSAGRE